jgi:hypothetical protein
MLSMSGGLHVTAVAVHTQWCCASARRVWHLLRHNVDVMRACAVPCCAAAHCAVPCCAV